MKYIVEWRNGMNTIDGNPSLRKLIDRATDEIIKLDYTANTTAFYRRTWKRFEAYSTVRGISEFSEQIGAEFLKSVYGWPSEARNTSYMNAAARAVRVLGDLLRHGIILRCKRIIRREWEDYYAETLDQFKNYAKPKLTHGSIFRIEQVLSDFFTYLLAHDILDCTHISPKYIEGFAATLSGYAKKTLAICMYGLRVFLGFLYAEGIVDNDLRASVPSLTYVNRRNVPTTWSKEETERIINAVDRANPCGKRDYAILLTIARLGLRQSDITGLMFEHIDWPKCTISIVQAKTKRPLSLPLPEDVGNAIIDYLKNGRPPCEDPYVFLKHTPPFGQLHSVYMLLDKHVRLAKIKRPVGGPKGPHTLRHSLAGRLLENGVTVETISAVLGHTLSNSTLDYLKIDTSSLSECALDPEGVLLDA